VSIEQPGMQQQMDALARPAPSWMVGRFGLSYATDPTQPPDLIVDGNGQMRRRIGDRTALGQYIGNGRILWAQGQESSVEQRGEGLRITDRAAPSGASIFIRR
jgi:hypothetical protein